MKSEQAIIPIINIFPGMNPEILETASRNANAIVLVVFGTGGSAGNLNETIKKLTDDNIPVFLVAEKSGNDFGITRTIDQTQVESNEAGAIPIEKLNYSDIDKIVAVIQEKISDGIKGKELGTAIREHFSYKQESAKPIPEWENALKRK